MIVKDFACLATEGSRSRAYLQKLVANGFDPEKVFLIKLAKRKASEDKAEECDSVRALIMEVFRERKYFLYSNSSSAIAPRGEKRPSLYRSFDPDETVKETLRMAGIEYEEVEADSLNADSVMQVVRNSSQQYFMFCGGGILRETMLNQGKRFIHIHPGLLPFVKGSMGIEWSILLRGRCAVSAIFMTEGVDKGEIIATREFGLPVIEHTNIASLFSAHIRSELLVDIISEYVKTGMFSATAQDPQEGNTYYKMHPLINNVVFGRCRAASTKSAENG